MGRRLTKFERGARFTGDFAAAIAALHHRLDMLQRSQQVAQQRSILVFEGWEGAGKKAALRRLTAAWDPCQFTAHCVRTLGLDSSSRHWLAPFWQRLPEPGSSAIFFRSWYRAVVDARAAGALDDDKWSRALDEINEFEAQQADHGTTLVKLFFHVSAEVQERRLRACREDPWASAAMTPDKCADQAARDPYLRAWEDMFEQTDTRWAPWRIVDSGDDQAGQVAALTVVAELLGKALPLAPPQHEAAVVRLAQSSYA